MSWRRRLIASRTAARRRASRLSRTRIGSVVFDVYVSVQASSASQRLSSLTERSTPLVLSAQTSWYRLDATGSHRYLLTVETDRDLPADSRAALVQYRFISERGRVRRDVDVGKAWSARHGYHEYLPRAPRDRASAFLVLTPPGTRAVDVGFSAAVDGPVSIRDAALTDLGARTVIAPYDVPVAAPRNELRLAVIADTFTVTALRLEAHVFEVPATGWARPFDEFAPDLLLVESAWNGNDGAWLYRIAGMKLEDRRLANLVAHARSAGVTVLFWNKEDPAHYDDFLAAARLCDVVATTDAEMIPRYVTDLGHGRVFALPFCIQRDIHNPRQPHDATQERLSDAAFLGSWWASKFDARRDAQVALFEGSSEFGLQIFDRYLTFNDHERYRLPAHWLPYVHGTLAYDQALSAYRRYAVVLNVNTVTDSPTMFSRRALEAAACGAVVVTNPSAGTTAALGEVVISVLDADECRRALVTLGSDLGQREAHAHLAYRHVHHHHSWTNRLDDVARFCNVAPPRRTRPKITVVLATKRPAGADRILRYLAEIDDPAVELEPVVVTAFDPGDLAAADAIERMRALVIEERPGETLGECLNRGAAAGSGGFIAKIDDDDIYGPNYFQDLLLALDYSRADIVGKRCHYQHFEVNDTTVIRYPGNEHRFTTFVCGSTLLVRAGVYETIQFPRQRVGEDTEFLRRATQAGLSIFSADRFSYVSQRRADIASHTWREEHEALLTSPMTRHWCDGLPASHIDL